MASIINLYKKIDAAKVREIGLRVSPPNLSYRYEGEAISIDIPKTNEILISDLDSNWSPDLNELKVEISVQIEKPILLFGANGVTDYKNKIGFGAHVYSSEGKFQYSQNLGTISYQNQENFWLLTKTFPPGSLRGKVFFHLFLYLQEVHQVQKHQANLAGMKLSESNLCEFSISVDGEGSTFPIGEYEEKGGPLWKMETYFTEPDTDLFNYDNIRILFNTKHPVFAQVKEEKTKVSKTLMQEIMIEAMAMIINKVYFEGDILAQDIDDEPAPGTVLAAVQYWKSTFDVDISNTISVMNSLRVAMLNIDSSEEEQE